MHSAVKKRKKLLKGVQTLLKRFLLLFSNTVFKYAQHLLYNTDNVCISCDFQQAARSFSWISSKYEMLSNFSQTEHSDRTPRDVCRDENGLHWAWFKIYINISLHFSPHQNLHWWKSMIVLIPRCSNPALGKKKNDQRWKIWGQNSLLLQIKLFNKCSLHQKLHTLSRKGGGNKTKKQKGRTRHAPPPFVKSLS